MGPEGAACSWRGEEAGVDAQRQEPGEAKGAEALVGLPEPEPWPQLVSFRQSCRSIPGRAGGRAEGAGGGAPSACKVPRRHRHRLVAAAAAESVAVRRALAPRAASAWEPERRAPGGGEGRGRREPRRGTRRGRAEGGAGEGEGGGRESEVEPGRAGAKERARERRGGRGERHTHADTHGHWNSIRKK